MARETVLYEVSKTLEIVRVLDASVLNEYNESVRSAYNSDRARAVLSRFGEFKGELTGSNTFMLVHLQNAGLAKGRIATRADLEKALRFGLNLSGNYVNFGLALRTARDSYLLNDLLAKTLAGQLDKREVKIGEGKFIPISALGLREVPDSYYGLVFDLKDGAEVEDLSKQRWNYFKEEGLVGAYLVRGGDWYSNDRYLDSSSGNGRV